MTAVATRAPEGPQLSVVVTSRHDDHGGDLLFRMQHFVTGLAAQAHRHTLPVELILVEWNAPADRSSLATALHWPEPTRYFHPRVIAVPASLHQTLAHADALPLFQMLAKNVGIRRATAPYILATNIDILFPDALMRTLKTRLRPGVIFRTDRHDVACDVPESAEVAAVLAYCDAHVIRQHRADGTFLPANGAWVCRNPSYRVLPLRLTRLAIRRWRHAVRQEVNLAYNPVVQTMRRWLDARGLLHPMERRRLLNNRRTRRGAAAVVRTAIALALGGRTVFRRERRAPWWNRLQAHTTHIAFQSRVHRAYVRLHTNACGDFTLADRDTWYALHGYPEWQIFSWHLDSVLLFQAEAHGIPVVRFPRACATYHIDHGAGWTPEVEEDLFARLERRGVPYLTIEALHDRIADMQTSVRQGRPVVYNDDSWGFAHVPLRETVPGSPPQIPGAAVPVASRD